MATPLQIRTTVDNWLAARWPTVQNLQTTYASNHNGRYYQGLWTHLNIPIDAVDTTPNNINVKPTDQTETWNNFVTLPASFCCSFCIDVYRNNVGWGYVATVRVVIAALGKTFERSQNGAGNETWRTVAWHQLNNVN